MSSESPSDGDNNTNTMPRRSTRSSNKRTLRKHSKSSIATRHQSTTKKQATTHHGFSDAGSGADLILEAEGGNKGDER